MGRSISQTTGGGFISISSTYNPSGVFGSGVVFPCTASFAFVVPADVTAVRVRCFGGGGGGANEYTQGSSGGTSSFGAYVSATGGTGGKGRSYSGQTHLGGTGSGGDINFTGGSGKSTSTYPSEQPGGGVASYFGNGGHAAWPVSNTNTSGGDGYGGAGGGGAINTSSGQTTGGSGFMSAGAVQRNAYSTTPASFVPAQHPIGQGWSVDMYGTGGGGVVSLRGINGGGGGAISAGSFPGGGSGGMYGGGAGGGFAMLTITGLISGNSINVTVGAGGNGGSNIYPAGAHGLVVIEY